MKFRQGFDSNCSSMSFVISKDEFAGIKDLAKAMIDFMFKIEQIGGNYIGDNFYNEIRHKEYLEALKEAPDVDALKFYSCNYDTLIYEGENKYFVETCNNHDMWSFLYKKMEYPEFTIKTPVYNIHTKELKSENINGDSGWGDSGW
jgi:hypothetical protein